MGDVLTKFRKEYKEDELREVARYILDQVKYNPALKHFQTS